MCGRIPVIFDYLGGDGMVSPNTFDEIRKNNFSGRRYKKNFSAEDLVNEINEYRQNYGNELRELALDNFSASKYVKHIIDIYKSVIEKGHIKINDDNRRSVEYIMYLTRETKMYAHEIAVRNTTHFLQNEFKVRENVLVAELMINGGEYEKAINILNETLAYDPDNLDALNNISVAYILNGNIPAASETIQKVLKIKPNDEVANSNYEYINTRFQKQKVS